MARFAVILPAAGRSTRFGDPDRKKTYADLGGRGVWLRASDPFTGRDDVAQVIVAIHPEDRELFDRRYAAEVAFRGITVIEGGAERFDTIALALVAVIPEVDHIAVHDAARPCLTGEQVSAVFAAAIEHGAALLAVPVADTLKRVGPDGRTIATVPRAGLFGAQTPQVFRRDLLEQAYAARQTLLAGGVSITDDAQLVEALGHACMIVPGSATNLKITTPDDLKLAAAILQSRPKPSHPDFLHPLTDERANAQTGGFRQTLDDLF